MRPAAQRSHGVLEQPREWREWGSLAAVRSVTTFRHSLLNYYMSTIFDKVPLAPEDAVFGLSAQCNADPSPNKVNLVIGAYRDEDLKPWVLPVVRQVQTQLATDANQNHEYLAIDGSPVRAL